jgi:citrate lyase subunit beta/citryl-CoA lyase
MGFDGKWAIHPDQVPVINRIFTPSQEEITRAQEIIALYEKSDADSGVGAIVYKDEMVDAASLPIERKKLAIAKKIGLL